jgi:hypothetical protein
MEELTFDEFETILDDGYQVYFTYLQNRYLIFKTTENCYTKKLIHQGSKNPPAKMAMITKKYLSEIYEFMENIEYKYEA